MNDILKMKIVRDFNKIFYNKSLSLLKQSQINKLRSSYTSNYLNLLGLIRNTWFQQVIIPTKKFGISDLTKINAGFLEDVSKLNNIEVVDSPMFQRMYVENNTIKTITCSVSQVRVLDTIQYIKNNRNNYIFHIYQIDEFNARWYRREDKNWLRKNRRDKLENLQNLKKIEIEL